MPVKTDLDLACLNTGSINQFYGYRFKFFKDFLDAFALKTTSEAIFTY